MLIKVAGIDPALANFGVALMSLDLDTMALSVDQLHLLQTERRTSKQVRQNSDDLRRAQEIVRGFHTLVEHVRFVFAEIPSGGQSADAIKSFGISIGMLASCPKPLIQVQPFETKLAAVGTKTASKQEMIEWAGETYPKAPWLRHDRNGKTFKKGDLKNDNEHLADAVAVVHAGVQTEEFKRFVAMFKAAA